LYLSILITLQFAILQIQKIMYLDDNMIPDIKPKWWCWLWNAVSEHHYSSLKTTFKKKIFL